MIPVPWPLKDIYRDHRAAVIVYALGEFSHRDERGTMSMVELMPPIMVGTVFTIIGAAKFVGLKEGIVGGKDVQLRQKLCGT
ncbi:MAG: hypothetical protein P1V97_35090 [Planctomycetota bacterium]|nr:hypothetical protein [Planctomycetota bacterium]